SSLSWLRDGTHPLAAGPGNPGLSHRPGRSDRPRRWVPKEPGPGRQVDSKDSPVGVSRFGGQAGTQATDPTPKPIQNHGSRAGALSTSSLPITRSFTGFHLGGAARTDYLFFLV